MNEEFYVGQIFEGEYPIEVSDWCTESDKYSIEEIDEKDGKRRFQIKEIPSLTPQEKEQQFLEDFFYIPQIGYFRKIPKGYNGLVEAMNTTFNLVSSLGYLPENTLQFYRIPDFTNEDQCSEEWLIANSFKNSQMTKENFNNLYINCMTAWNKQEHL